MGYDLVNRGISWADDILTGKRETGHLAKLACERFETDYATADFPYRFDADEAERWLQFLTGLKHVKGRWAGLPFDPSGYQCFCTMNIYGWRTREETTDEETGEVTLAGRRRFLEAYIEVARKNGKSFWFAGLGLGHLCIDNEVGAEVYTGATTEKQAWEVFRPARTMLVRDTGLAGELGVEVNAKSLWRLEDGGRFEPVIGNPGDGPSPSCSIADEYHEHRNRDQVDTMETGMAARAQPLSLKITTAGVDFGGPCYEEHQESIAILERKLFDETKFCMIFAADLDVAWDSDLALRQANPNLGISVSKQYLEARRKKARNSPVLQSAFKTKYLDLWVGARIAWMNMLRLQRCVHKDMTLDDFEGQTCYAGIDLATRVDIASLAIVFPHNKGLAGFCFHWAPEAAVTGEDAKNVNYRGWADAGYLRVTPGDTIDYDFIEEEVGKLRERFNIAEMGYDPYQATQFATHMQGRGLPMVEIRPSVLNFSEPMSELDDQVIDRNFAYNGDPVLTWMFGNVVAKMRGMHSDLIMPDKERPEQKIDGVVALIMAVNRWIAHKDEQIPEGYKLTVL